MTTDLLSEVAVDLLSRLPLMSPERADLVVSAFWPMLRAGITISVPMAIASFVFGMIIALLVALARISPSRTVASRLIKAFCRLYISIIRGTPMLVQICIVFYGLPALDITIDPVPSAIIAFSLNIGAYASETVRAAIQSVSKSQWEAGFSIGMTYMQTFRRIIVPQAARVSVPPLSNTFIGLFKDTSLASVVTVAELFRVGQEAANRSYDFLPIYIEAGLIYWCFCFVLSLIQSWLEKRLRRSEAA